MRKRILIMLAAIIAAVSIAGTSTASATPVNTDEVTVESVMAQGDVQTQTSSACRSYIEAAGYRVGPLVTRACRIGVDSYQQAAVLVGAFALTTGLAVVPAFAEGDDPAGGAPVPQEVPAPQLDAASNVGPFGGPSDPDSDGPGSSESRSAGSLGFSADDPSWIA
ncbi:hypothetical protein [Glycomyces buryatensis]|uniref:Uncharacterized protein n=1 Tax=Glycomyces buryatensis TaxID=2570927 RepID=A0A4S8QB55_9ACTN|nr:hypothetical protein [Glycomyces buryatensis]THV41500.1 hypothetical protein FAB82_11275 [Glycomyces buryatensis]